MERSRLLQPKYFICTTHLKLLKLLLSCGFFPPRFPVTWMLLAVPPGQGWVKINYNQLLSVVCV